MTIIVDTREKPHAIKTILAQFNAAGVEVIRQKLDAGDYMVPGGTVSVDRKQNLLEVCGNVCQQHARFSRECQRAQESGVRLVFLVEHGGKVRTLEDVKAWKNPRLDISPYAVSGVRLWRIMQTYAEKYGVEWQFCDKRQTGKRIMEILTE